VSPPWLAVYDDRVCVHEESGEFICEITGGDYAASILIAERIAKAVNLSQEIAGESLRDSRIIPPSQTEGVGMTIADGGIGPDEVKAARTASGLTQAEAAAVVYTSINNWQNWEQGRYFMVPAVYELFLLKTGQFTLREMVPGENFTIMRLRLRTGHVIDMAVKNEVAVDMAGLATE